jgi:rhamnosyl/mannosyltransferase
LEVGEFGRFQSAPLSPLFPWWLRRTRADVMVLHVPNPTAEIAWLLVRPRTKLVVRYHSDVVRQASAMFVYGPVQQWFLRTADLIIPTSQPYLDSSVTLQPHRERCRVVPMGIVPSDFDPPPEESIRRLRERYGRPFVFFCGQHRYYKGLDVLIRAARRIHAPVVVAGDGPERERCRQLSKAIGVNVAFPGELSQADLVAHLHACDVFAFPSIARSEAFGIAILEAHVCGKPVVATNLGTGVEFVNLDGQTGLNVPPNDADALSNGINALLDDPEMRRRYGEFARQRARTQFDAATIARIEFELYTSLLA